MKKEKLITLRENPKEEKNGIPQSLIRYAGKKFNKSGQ